MMAHASKKLSAPRGFTLLELLVALAMIAILSEALYLSLSVGFKVQDTGTRAMEPVQRMANAFTLLAGDFDGAMPPTGTLAGEFTGTATSGSPSSGANTGSSTGTSSGISSSNLNSKTSGLHAPSADGSAVTVLAFYSSSNAPLDGEIGGDVRKVELSVETPEGDSHLALVRRVYTNLMPSKAPEPRVQILARDVRSFSARYYDGSVWRDDWDSQNENNILPMAVECTLEINLPQARNGEDITFYRMTRVFKLPCGVNAADAAAAASATTSSGSGTGTGGGGGTGGGR